MNYTLVDSSLHIGYKNESNYKKGLECLIDAKMLDRCDVFYKSKGNFSLFCYYFNEKENIEYYDLNDIVKGKKINFYYYYYYLQDYLKYC